ncbi:FMN-dependent NADH-azoreductase [Parablastomonas sp. CN1-191]|uniref:FMN-dependent NADH-azoreductase n=1 Tax=Parablastomonas sp. CN1-191 TaxID=3400908 RepID=UPI003BF794C8
MTILHIDSSITGENSVSRELSAAIVKELLAADPGARVVTRDLVAQPLDHLTLAGFGSDESRAVLEEFKAADTIVIGAGFYNFSIPSQLKAWFDRILVAGETFRYTENGPEGLAGDKTVIVALARGGFYGEESPMRSIEHAESYMAAALGFIGIKNPRFVIAEGIAIGPEQRASSLAQAHRQVPEAAARALAA